MFPAAALLIFQTLAALFLPVSPLCENEVSCPCGSTGRNYTFCNINNLTIKEVCQTWSRCLQCQDELDYCLECPVGMVGETCSGNETPICQDPGFLLDGTRKRNDGSLANRSEVFREGEVLIFSCLRGSALEGSSMITCTKDGKWSDELPRCLRFVVGRGASAGYCPDPGTLINGDRFNTDGIYPIQGMTYRLGQSVVFSCHSGFVLHGASMITCQRLGSWSGGKPFCASSPLHRTKTVTNAVIPENNLQLCDDPGIAMNGLRTVHPALNPKRRLSGFPLGSQLKFSCKEGFTLQGWDSLFCLIGGKWSSPPPICSQQSDEDFVEEDLMYCRSPGPIFHGKIDVLASLEEERDHFTNNDTGAFDDDEYPQGTSLHYICEEGYTLKGNALITCEDTGFWSARPPSCIGVCGQLSEKISHPITPGRYAKADEWPWMVGVAEVRRNSSRLSCGGVLLNSRTVLTVAKCVSGQKTYMLLFGKYKYRTEDDDDKVLQRTNVTVNIHPNFINSKFTADIALVHFTPSITFSDRIQPICLPTPETTSKNIADGQKGYVTSWGLNREFKASDSLKTSYLTVIAEDSCLKGSEILPPNWSDLLKPNMFCVDFSEGPNEICFGDGGSPMVFYDNVKKRFVLEGLVSFGSFSTCGQPGSYNALTEVLPYVPWIMQNSI